jgi:hypothetical protein
LLSEHSLSVFQNNQVTLKAPLLRNKIEKYKAGLPDFSWHNIPKRGKIYQTTKKLPNFHYVKMQNCPKKFKWPYNMQTFSIPRPPKIYPNWDFWFEKIPSGNPGTKGLENTFSTKDIVLTKQSNV